MFSPPGTCFAEPVVVGGAEPTRGEAGPQIGAAEQFGVDADAAGDHQPGRERARFGDRIGLLGQPQATPAAGTADPGKAAAGSLGGGSSRLTAGGSHRGQILLDDRRVGVFEHRYRRRHGSCTPCASIASTARRYWPASQSLAKCS